MQALEELGRVRLSTFRSVAVNDGGVENMHKGYDKAAPERNHSRHVWDRRDAEYPGLPKPRF